MAHIISYLAPFRIYITVSKFYQVKGILHIRAELVNWRYFGSVELAGHTCIQYGQGSGAYIFGQLKIFKETEPERLKIIRCGAVCEFTVPAVNDQLTVFQSAQGFFPLVAQRKIVAFNNTSAGKTNEAGLHIRQ